MTQPTLTTTRAGMPMDEFIRRYETEGPFELIEGELVGMSPTIFGHGRIAKRLLMAISAHASPGNLGEAFMEMPFVVTDPDSPAWVKGSRVPDVAYFQNDRLKAYEAAHPDSEEKPLALVPDLVVEVVSTALHDISVR
jgi:Uma2 family endonuclease